MGRAQERAQESAQESAQERAKRGAPRTVLKTVPRKSAPPRGMRDQERAQKYALMCVWKCSHEHLCVASQRNLMNM